LFRLLLKDAASPASPESSSSEVKGVTGRRVPRGWRRRDDGRAREESRRVGLRKRWGGREVEGTAAAGRRWFQGRRRLHRRVKNGGKRRVTCGSDFVCSRGFLSETKSEPPCDRARRRKIGRPKTGGSSVLSGLRALFSVWVNKKNIGSQIIRVLCSYWLKSKWPGSMTCPILTFGETKS
jgi:hypothetical protein